jgi:hypothetical protein
MFFIIFDEVEKNDLANEGCRQGPKNALETSFRGFAPMTVCNREGGARTASGPLRVSGPLVFE